MTVFTIVISLVTTMAALVTVWFAWKAGKASESATQAARETAEVLERIRDADETWRARQALHALQSRVEAVRQATRTIATGVDGVWCCDEQVQLRLAMLASTPHGLKLPACELLCEKTNLVEIIQQAAAADAELAGALCSLRPPTTATSWTWTSVTVSHD